jgi:aminomethyltransferase
MHTNRLTLLRAISKSTKFTNVIRTASTDSGPVRKTALYDFHAQNKAKFVPFAGWKMPVIYPEGMKQEHMHCRSQASIFDVSHMGQIK